MLRAFVALVLCFGGNAFAQPGPDAPPRRASLREVMMRFRSAVENQPKPVVTLVTMGIGSLMWERHGHIALCINYERPEDDTCYNYGIGDFRHPAKMAWGFFRGTNSFWVGRQDPQEMLWVYHHADRTIWVQPLPLSKDEVAKVIDKLERDVQEENKYYAYDHFWDNCTTRVRDVLDTATNGSLRAMTESGGDRTYRDLARDGFYGMRIPLLITDIAMARATDRVPSYWERMFLPDYMRDAAKTRWGVEPIAVYERIGAPPLRGGPSGRIWLALVVVALTASAWLTRLWGRFERAGLAFAVMPAAFLGLVFWGLAVISPLPYVRWNETCLILMPFDALLVLLPAAKARAYARARVVMLGVVAVLMLVNVLKAPLFSIWLWPLIPAAVVGFWPVRAAKVGKAADTPVPKKQMA
ncbi:MAG TPA: DUF4105 domain-containing protein [Kofleriaceae bacterium]|nr:DUF4105 domain-containing protein [Kofleriaceae bacterium]